jgi:hypothetical protein
MGGYYGSPASVMKNNNAQRVKKRTLKDWKDFVGVKEIQTADHIQATPEILAEIRKKLQTENKLRLRKKIIKTVIFLAVIIIAFTILNRYFSKNILY